MFATFRNLRFMVHEKKLFFGLWLVAMAIMLVFSAMCGSAHAKDLTLISIGDSLTEGAGDDQWEGGVTVGYPGRVATKLTGSGHTVQKHNLGAAGYTIGDMITPYEGPGQLDQSLNLIQEAVANGRQPVTMIWAGSNDLWAVYEDKCTAASPPACAASDVQEFAGSLETILSQLSSTQTILLVALLDDHSKRPVVADPSYPAHSEITPDELPLLSDQTRSYNDEIQRLAQQYGATVVDTWNTQIFEGPPTISEDGDHPNTQGYDQLAHIWYQALVSALDGAPPGDPGDLPQTIQSYEILTPSTGVHEVPRGDYQRIYGTVGEDTITMKSGGRADLRNMINANQITFEEASSGFSVSRSGGVVSLSRADTGTLLRIPATQTRQTIRFSDRTYYLVIKNARVMLGNQQITLEDRSISP